MSQIMATPAGSWDLRTGLGECPTWIATRRRLLLIDGLAGHVLTLNPEGGTWEAMRFDRRVASAVPARRGGAVVALAGGLARIGRDGTVEPLPSAVADGVVFNDGKCDARGRFWIGSRSAEGQPGEGALFCVDADGGVRREAEGFDICNGMGWSPDGRSFYLIDTVPRIVYRYGFDPDRGLTGPREVLHQFDGRRGKPDGMAVDAQGRILCAMWDGAGIAVISPAGAPLGWIDVPARRPTSLAFGGPDLRTLFVTTATVGIEPDAPDRGQAGAVLAFTCDVAGTPVALYN